jgi:hypothetical protein
MKEGSIFYTPRAGGSFGRSVALTRLQFGNNSSAKSPTLQPLLLEVCSDSWGLLGMANKTATELRAPRGPPAPPYKIISNKDAKYVHIELKTASIYIKRSNLKSCIESMILGCS